MLRSRKPRLDEALCAEHPELLEEHQNILARAQKCRSQEECAKLNNEIKVLRSRMLEVGFIKASLPAYRKYDPQSAFIPSAAVYEDEAEFYTEAAEAADAVKEQEEVISPEDVALCFGRLWEKGGHRRVYLDEKAVAKAVGFELRSVRGTKRYFLEDDEYTNSAMAKIFQAFDGTYYDLAKKDFVSASSKNDLLDRFQAVFAHAVEAAKNSSSEPDPRQSEEPEKEEATPAEKETYDPERHMRVAEVKAIFKNLHPHAPHSTRLSIDNITLGGEAGEIYRMGLSYTGEDARCPGLLWRLSHPASTMAISRRVTSDKLWGGWAQMYEIVFDRGVVEGLIKTWKESDPVRDSRADEAARKERAKARKEAQSA